MQGYIPVRVWFNESACSIQFVSKSGATIYDVDLETCNTSAEMLDWVMQVARKRWLSDAALGEYVRLMNRLMAPQACLCSFGKDHGPIPNVRQHVATVREGLSIEVPITIEHGVDDDAEGLMDVLGDVKHKKASQ